MNKRLKVISIISLSVFGSLTIWLTDERTALRNHISRPSTPLKKALKKGTTHF